MGNEIVMLAVVGIGGYLVLKSGLLNNLGGGGGGDAAPEDTSQAAPAPAPDPAAAAPDAAAAPAPTAYPYAVPYPVPVGYNVPYDLIYLQDNLVGGYCHLNGNKVCWVGPTGLLSCFNLSRNDFDRWHLDSNLRVRVCRSIRGRYISAHPFRRLPKSRHTPPHRTNNDHNCGRGNHYDPRLHRCVDDSPNHPPGPPGVHHCPDGQHWDNPSNHCVPDLGHGGGGPGGPGGGGDHGGPPGGGPHNCGLHQHWDDHMNHCVEDSTPPAGGGPPHPGTGNPPPPGQSHFAISI